MPRESMKSKRERALEVANRMGAHYPDAECALIFDNDPFHLTIATLLSAQTTDKGVNKVTPVLWKRYPTIADLASANVEDVEEIIRTIGFHHAKARNCVKCAQMVLTDFGGEVPHTYEELEQLPGVGRKTANIVMNTGFGIVEGIAVDTHVKRIAQRLKFTNQDDPSKIEQDLLKLYPKEYWGPVNHEWVLFGRGVCDAQRPHCDNCFLSDICPSFGKAAPKKRSKK